MRIYFEADSIYSPFRQAKFILLHFKALFGWAEIPFYICFIITQNKHENNQPEYSGRHKSFPVPR